MHKLLPGIVIITQLLLSSCGVPKNFHNAVYFKDSVTEASKIVINNPVLIQQGDRLDIHITAINKEAAEAFNAPQTATATETTGYLVDSLGNIQLLQLGVIHVEGLTTGKLEADLQQQLVNYIKGPISNGISFQL